ncbi:MAG TPA: tripartite tricarboxylate transporter permease [Candidatus Thermoplasmatota archaeon]|nr:tripartite tricarboxylate transporter permease [Candidatus Thermoplasmatota archaeon]
MTPLAAAGLGTLLGCAAGLVPGLHPNALVSLLLAVGGADPVLLVAMAGSHGMVATLPSTYLGVPGEEGQLGALPAHRMVLEGRGPEAVRVATSSALGATLLAVLLLLPFKWLWAQPAAAARFLPWAVPFVLAAVPLWLAWGERGKGWRAAAWGVTAFLLAGLLGLLAGRLPSLAWLSAPPSPLGALLSGLFGGAGLLASASAGRRLPGQQAPRAPSRRAAWSMAGATSAAVAASAATALVPGATPALVASATPRTRGAAGGLASFSAVGAAQPLFALALLWLTGQARSGLALGVEAGGPVQAWTSGRAPTLLLEALAAWLAAAAIGCLVAHALDRPAARWLPRLPQAPLAWCALAGLVVLAGLGAGWTGLLLFAAGTATGLLPIAAGVRRVHLTGSLLLPLLLAR